MFWSTDCYKIEKSKESVFKANEMGNVRTTLYWHQRCFFFDSQFKPSMHFWLFSNVTDLIPVVESLILFEAIRKEMNCFSQLLISFIQKTRFFLLAFSRVSLI